MCDRGAGQWRGARSTSRPDKVSASDILLALRTKDLTYTADLPLRVN